MAGERHSVPADARLRDSKDKQIGIRLPLALDQRLDDLVARANDAGANTTRRETMAALLLDADMTGEELSAAIRNYRTALVRDAPLNSAAMGGSQVSNILEFPAHRPGPRTTA